MLIPEGHLDSRCRQIQIPQRIQTRAPFPCSALLHPARAHASWPIASPRAESSGCLYVEASTLECTTYKVLLYLCLFSRQHCDGNIILIAIATALPMPTMSHSRQCHSNVSRSPSLSLFCLGASSATGCPCPCLPPGVHPSWVFQGQPGPSGAAAN